MERLTRRMKSGKATVVAKMYIEKATYDAMQKLATYEDAEEQGLFVRLPCLVNGRSVLKRHSTTGKLITVRYDTREEAEARALTHANIQAMGGLPIFIKPIGFSGYSWTSGWWVFLKAHKQTERGDTMGYIFSDAYGEFDYSANDYGKTWLAYDRKPKEER